MEEVLYHPTLGYYSSDRNPIGMEADFFTSPDLDPIFGKILAKRFEQMAEGMESFSLLELGAGKGLLARDILEHQKFPYIILERSPAMRRRQQELLQKYAVRWVDDLPPGFHGCIFSNEFFDALPVHRVIRRGDTLKEIYVSEGFKEIEGELQAPLADCLDRMKEGQIADISLESRSWIRRIAASLERGYHVAIDYGYLAAQFYAQPYGTLMCYWQHQATEDPYARIGEQDLTAHVNFSDLINAGEANGLNVLSFQNQKDFLVQEGILNDIQRLSVAGDAESMQRLLRIKRLIIPGSMGERFKVLIQTKGICTTSPEPPTPLPPRGRN
jgi:SAM-dependent MidA family methyltransferase